MTTYHQDEYGHNYELSYEGVVLIHPPICYGLAKDCHNNAVFERRYSGGAYIRLCWKCAKEFGWVRRLG